MRLLCTLHAGHHPGDILGSGGALLPADVPAVVVAGPDLDTVDDLPDRGAVLLGHVLTLVQLLRVHLRSYDLFATLESLVGLDRLAFVQYNVLHVHRAISEQLDLLKRINDKLR